MIVRQDVIDLVEALLAAVEREEDLIAAATAQDTAVAAACAAALRDGASLTEALHTALTGAAGAAIDPAVLALGEHDPRALLAAALTTWRLQAERRRWWWQALSVPLASLAMVGLTAALARWWAHPLALGYLWLLPAGLVCLLVPWLAACGPHGWLPRSWRWRAAAKSAQHWRLVAVLCGRRIPEARLPALFGEQAAVAAVLPVLARADGAPTALALAELYEAQAVRRLRRAGWTALTGIYLLSAAIILASAAGALAAGALVPPTGLLVPDLPPLVAPDVPPLVAP